MADKPYPVVGLPLAELQAVVAALEHVQPKVSRILNISVKKGGNIEVTTGEQRGALSGGGEILVLRKSGAGWVVAVRGGWIS